MKKIYVSVASIFFASAIVVGCNAQPASQDDILINQIGYPVDAAKKGLIRGNVESFFIKDAGGNVVFEGEVSEPKYWELSGDAVGVADFSALTQTGNFTLCVEDICSYSFEIGENLYSDLADAAIKSYYYARVGVDIEKEFGGKWNYKAGHPDTEVLIHASAADEHRPEGSTISSPGGWYDAGDYGKYIVNSSITTWTILQSYRMNSDFHTSQSLNIPESVNDLPDILDEALVNLKWMMTMQDPNDGGVYHKLTTKNFDAFIMPDETTNPRYVMMKSTSAALICSAL